MNSNLLLTAEIGFILITIVYMTLLVLQLKKGIDRTSWDASRKKKIIRVIVSGLLLWFAFVAYWSGTGLMSDFSQFPFNFMPVIAIPLVIIIGLMIFSANLTEIVNNIEPNTILNLQSFRVFVEVLLWVLFVAGAAPEQMTFEGRNFDILAGITGPIVAWFMVRNKISKSLIILWNVACLGLLINIVTIAVLSTPSPWRIFMEEPSNTIVTYFPVSLLPAFLVPLAYTLHFISLKQALSSIRSKNPALNRA